ncbi:Protein of unknown function (DUF2993) [Rubrobacter radiotolerans]|uniref:DUF2993 domain-containing protein n=1 Tax=Rubrobacter radiotolerans TaxID=42256 RepID=A0A023X2Z6_RUBRA|nr:Protein of unknown function (DUF2993) [Rubrobacter radiotolerans]SMC05558.1 Protein of unknown function [Rubrobacter radiotolerans DSM 5868]
MLFAGLGVVALGAVAVGVFLVIASYTFLPGFVSERIADRVQEELGLERTPEVTVRSDPPTDILRGRFSDGTVDIGPGEIWGFEVERILVDLDPFDVDVPASVLRREVVYSNPTGGTLEAEVPEREIARIASEEAGIEGISLEDGSLVVEQAPEIIGGVDLPVRVAGDVSLRGESLVYEPETVEVAGVALPQNVRERVLEGVDLAFPVEGVTDGVELQEAEVVGERLVLRGEVEGLS